MTCAVTPLPFYPWATPWPSRAEGGKGLIDEDALQRNEALGHTPFHEAGENALVDTVSLPAKYPSMRCRPMRKEGISRHFPPAAAGDQNPENRIPNPAKIGSRCASDSRFGCLVKKLLNELPLRIIQRIKRHLFPLKIGHTFFIGQQKSNLSR